MKGDLVFHRFRDILEVLLVGLGQNDLPDAGPMGRQDLLLDPAHRQHLAAQGDFPGHGEVLFYLATGKQRHEGREHGYPRRRPVLGDGTGRHVDVQVAVVEKILLDAQGLGVGADEAQRRGGRLLHHVPQLAGEGQILVALHGGGLDKEQAAAHRRPGQPHGHPGGQGALGGFGDELDRPQVAVKVVDADLGRLDFPPGHPSGHPAADGGDFALEVAQSGFPGIAADDAPQGAGGELDLRGVQPVGLALARDEKLPGDMDLLVLGVAHQLQHFHAVAQGRGNRVQHVGRGDEHHLGQIEGHVEVMVGEGVVLFRVEHLEQGR